MVKPTLPKSPRAQAAEILANWDEDVLTALLEELEERRRLRVEVVKSAAAHWEDLPLNHTPPTVWVPTVCRVWWNGGLLFDGTAPLDFVGELRHPVPKYVL